jgi:hypothetical protein
MYYIGGYILNIADVVDIGLNAINMNTNMIVPELARLPDSDPCAQGYDKYDQYYKNLEISSECVRLLCQYQN